MVFICLMTVNLQIRANYVSWPPAGVASLDRILPTLATVGLIVSGFYAARGLNGIRTEQRDAFFTNWRWALLLGVGFIAIMAFEWFIVPFSEQYSTIFRVMTAYHAIHALIIGWMMLRVYRNARAGAYSPSDQWAVEGAAKLWYFVVIAWILFYIVLYIV